MRVLAIDPGYDRLGVAVMEHDGVREVLLFSDCVTTDKKATISDRLFELGKTFEDLMQTHEPEVVAIENIFFNKNQKTAVAVAEARGVIVYIAQKYGATVRDFGPQEIKVAVTGYGASDKAAVTDMVKQLIPSAPVKALDDEYDAIAVGITALAHHRN